MMRIFRLALNALLLCVCMSCWAAAAAQANGELFQAAADGDAGKVRALIDKGADVNARDGTGRTAMMIAASKNQVEILRILLGKGADVNEKSAGATAAWTNGWTALMYAANHGSCDAVKILLNAGANPGVTADDGATVLAQATGCREDIMGALQRTGAESDVKNNSAAFLSAALTGDVVAVRSLLDKGADVNAKGPDGGTALMTAAVMGHADVMRLLMERGADVNRRTDEGETALTLTISKASDMDAIRALAASRGANSAAFGSAPQSTVATVRMLLDGGADVNAVTNDGGTALMYAAMAGDPEIVRALIDKGALVNARNVKGQPALMVAIETAITGMESDPPVVQRTVSVMRVLLDHGADVNAVGNLGETALMYAVTECDEATVQMLLDKGAKANATAPDGTSAMMLARATGCKIAVKQLRNAGAR